jgi:dipeptidyl aminopeptidase/acylaminoacyl peptidase
MRSLIALFLCGVSAFTLLTGCGGGNSGVLSPLTDAGSEQTLNFGSLTTRVAGTAQPPVTSSGSGSTVTGIAGATITSMTLAQPPSDELAKTKIVFQSVTNGSSDIYIMNSNGTGVQQVTNYPGNEFHPQLSPNGATIVFGGDMYGNADIYTINTDGSNLTRLTQASHNEEMPSWSPDGSKIVYRALTHNSAGELYTMNANGGGQTRLTTNSHAESEPIWSPKGDQIVYSSELSPTNREITVINLDGLNGVGETHRTTNNVFDIYPSWSPDGQYILFASERDGNRELYRMRSDGSGVTRLTATSHTESESFYSPDGSTIIYSSNGTNPGRFGIFGMDKNGGNSALIHLGSGNSFLPRWGWTTTKKMPLIGVNGKLGTAAAGFLYGRNGDTITSLLAFDSAATTRASARVSTTTGIASGLSNYSFMVTHPTALTALAYTNDVYGNPTSVIGSGGLSAASSVLVDYNAATGKVIAVIPFEANRAAEPTQTEGDTFRHRGKLLGVWNAEGKNLAPNGAAEVEVDAKTGTVRVVR